MVDTKRPTLKTIAQITGLAVPTVSRALKGADDIGKATKARVRQVASEIGYVPNHAGVRLRTGRTHVISMIMPTEPDLMTLTAQLINAAAGAMHVSNYQLTLVPCKQGSDLMVPVRQIVETRSADAVIINQIEPEDPRVRYLLDLEFPFATHGRSLWSERHAYYDFDNEAFGALAVAKLVARGRKAIRLLAPPRQQSYSLHMIAGAERAAKVHGVELEVIDGLQCDSPANQVRELAADLMDSGDAVGDAWIFPTAVSCLAAVSGFESRGAVLGKSMDILVKEASPFIRWCKPEILGIREDTTTAGQFLAQAAIERVERPNTPPMQFLELPEDD